MTINEKTIINMEQDLETKKETLLDKIAVILDMGKETGLNDAFMEKAGSLLESVAAEMKISPIQAALFAFIFDVSFLLQPLCTDGEAVLFAKLKCSKVKYLQYLNEIDELIKLNYVNKMRNHEDFPVYPGYMVPRNLVFSLRKGIALKPESNKNIGIRQFFCVLQGIFSSRYHDEMLYSDFCFSLSSLLEDNPQLEFVKRIQAINLDELDRNLLLYFCSRSASKNPGSFSDAGIVDLEAIREHFSDERDSDRVYRRLIKPLQEGNHPLQRLCLVEYANDNGMASTEEYILSYKGKQNLLSEIAGKNKINDGVFIKAPEIKEKTMCYNSEDNAKIEKLVNLLNPDRFKTVVNSLEGKGLRKGFACLFSGAPGTGKTETVYQIARRTRRDLFQVDISQVKSCWVGGSERNIKRIFTRYKDAAEELEIEPILFFNEADAVIGKRRELGSHSRAVDQMENTIQNIILQEIENLNGILIATTNLTENLDKAFDRRFLYKIEFGRPGMETRGKLWRSMLPELSEDEAAMLASRFDFSGGQIENAIRKCQVDLVLEGMEPSLDSPL
jgi:DNA polymerase III delta prime subunit